MPGFFQEVVRVVVCVSSRKGADEDGGAQGAKPEAKSNHEPSPG
jgi:hypothetical protein